MLSISSLAGCGKGDGGVPPEDMRIYTERFQLLGDAWPLGALATNLKLYLEDARDHGGTMPGYVPLKKTEAEAVVAEYAGFLATFNEGPSRIPRESPMTREQRAAEEARLKALRESLDRMRGLLLPYRTWLEDHFGMQRFFGSPPNQGPEAAH